MDEKLNENELLERVFMRLGNASTDDQLEEFTKKFLTPVLLKLASPNEDIKKKVLELLAQINRLLMSRGCVQLPMEGLFLQYQDPQCTQYIRNFTILYLKMGFTRLNNAKQLEYLSQLLSSMAGKPKPQQICLLQLAIPVFTMFSADKTLPVMKDVYAVLSKDKAIFDLFLNFVLDVLMLPYSAVASNKPDSQNSVVPPGLSHAALEQVLLPGMTIDSLEGIKLGILKFLSADLFDTAAIQVHLVVATGDTHHTISDYADHQIRRITEAPDWEDVRVMNKIMSIFLGSINLPGKPAVPPDEHRTAANMSLQLKIFPFLLKSRKCTCIFPACLQIVFQVEHGEGRNQARQKLKKFRIQFIHHLCEFTSDKVISIISPILLSTLLKLIATDDESDLERITFLAIGKIAKRSPTLFHKDTAVIQSLFQALHSKDPDTGLDILQTLSMIATACKTATPQTLAMIEAMVLDNVNQENPQCRLAALQIANILFPTNHVKSRYACLLVSADLRNDIREEANRGLLVRQQSNNNDGPNLPDFSSMVNFIYQTLHGGNGFKQSYVTVAGTLPFTPAILINMMQYLHHCLSASSGVTQEDTDNDISLVPISKYVQKILHDEHTVVHQYLSFIQEALKPAGTNQLHSVALVNLLEILASATDRLAPELNHDGMVWIRRFIWSSDDLIRNYSAQIFAILICHSGKEMVLQELTRLFTTVNDSSEAVQHGTINCIGHLIGQYLSHKNVETSLQMQVEDLDDSKMFEGKIEKAISETFMAIISFLASQSSLLLHTACDALGEVCKQSNMPLPDGATNNDGNSNEKSLPADKILSKADVIKQLAYIMNNSKDPKLCEKAALVLGMTCVGEKNFPHTKEVIRILFDASKKRDVDFQFTVGEALSCAGAGRMSTASRSKWVVRSSLVKEIAETKETMQWLLEKIVQDYITSDVAHVRKAACIWLLVLLKHSSKHSAVQEKMAEIQQAFSAMLSENDEIVQEVSSKGLSLIYEFGSEEFRKDIVSSLVDAMLVGKKKVQNVTADTKLFDNAMPLGDAGQLSTYKELCTLASDMNQPELVYRFLHLANHNALWNSKKGAAFGFASIASQAKKELEPHLKTLVPKLYRYQFDPNSKVREAMLSIWHAIVKDQRKVVDQYSQEIVSELLANLHNTAWRVRQSCCVAVGNFLNGRSLDSILEYLPQLWTMCLRDMDDIKETVRKAAEVACKTLQSVSIRMCDVSQGKLGQEAVRVLLPVMLEQGLASRVDEIRKLVLDTVVKMSKNAGSLLKPHIPILVVTLLESLSGLEPQQLNYLSFQLQKDPNMQEKLEDARISFSKSSPMMETVSLCVQHVDKTVLEDLVPRLAELLRSGLGLGTKAGCASFVVSLVQQCGEDLQPYAGKLLSALLSGLTDRSQAVCKRYAQTIGSLVRVAKDSSVSKLFARMKSWYLEKENETLQNTCGLVCKEIARSSPDVMANHATSILPVAFIAMHRKDKQTEVKSPWTDIWSENTPVSSRGIQLYLEEIISISSTLLSGRSWERKVEAADCLQTVVSTLGKDLPRKDLDSIVVALLSSLSGRTWDGKESIVSCIATVFVKCHDVMEDGTNKEIALAVLNESRKQKPAYKANAIKRVGQILGEKKVISFAEVYDVLKPIVDPVKPKNEEKTEEEEEETPDANLLINAFDCVGDAWPLEREQQLMQRKDILKVLTTSLKNHPWKIQLSILDSLRRYIGKVATDDDAEFLSEILTSVLTELFPCLGNVKYAAIRLKSLEVAKGLLCLIQTSKLEVSSEHKDLLRELYRILAILRNDNNENVKSHAVQLDMFLKNLM